MTTLRIGTRNSPLALAQADWVAREIETAGRGEVTCKLVSMTTTGDQLTDRSLLEAGGKGLFTKELDIALERGDVDILVHSLKDVPVELPVGQRIMAYPAREDPRDAFVSLEYKHFADLPHGAVLGTSSLRRAAFALAQRPDLKIVEFRGNVQTRLKKLGDGVADATFLAAAGLNRLGMADKASTLLDPYGFIGYGYDLSATRIVDWILGVRAPPANKNKYQTRSGAKATKKLDQLESVGHELNSARCQLRSIIWQETA